MQLYAGLLLYGVSLALMVRAGVGLDPWNAFHQGLARLLGWSLGSVLIAVGVAVMLAWLPLRLRPGIGTLSNVVVIGLVVDAVLPLVPQLDPLPARLALLLAGIVLNAVATAAYLGAGLGAGPRDGLMTGLVARTGWSVRRVRTGIEVSVLTAGLVLGGDVGIGTVLYAVGIGPLVHVLLPPLRAVPVAEPAPPLAA